MHLLPSELLRLELLTPVLLRLSPLRSVVLTPVLLTLVVRPVLGQAQAALSFNLQQTNSFLSQLLDTLSFFQLLSFLSKTLTLEFQYEHLLLQQRLVELLLLVGQQGN
ncbi:hypothetical protein [Roseibium sp. LAB1]